jgi:hypothetical protein
MADDDNADRSYSANSSDDESYNENDESDRDEVKEVRKLSYKDTTRIRLWRLVVTVVLLLTAFAVTFTTYTFLQQQEHENFVTAVRIYRMEYVSNATTCIHHIQRVTCEPQNFIFVSCTPIPCFKMTRLSCRNRSVCTILPNGWRQCGQSTENHPRCLRYILQLLFPIGIRCQCKLAVLPPSQLRITCE